MKLACSFKDLETGHPQIDSEHWILYHSFHSIFGSENVEVQKEFLKMYIADMKKHLMNEEALMEKENYSFRDTHLNAHHKIRETCDSIIKELNENANVLETAESFGKYFTQHVLEHDKDLANFITKIP